MINRDDIEVGDKCYTRDGGCLVARERHGHVYLGPWNASTHWYCCGSYSPGCDHPLDIIRIEKAPKPVVTVRWLVWNNDSIAVPYFEREDEAKAYDNIIKLTIINGKLDKAEQVK